ncbi:MAG: 1-deoxy-D-xylulose-5-phosphate synthase, partial [Deltaproteobacteria bacterium]|nr:1-deoxy-D-xylulose-5-phosphate synthase [Deltaproteobacteria bacterium]
FTFEENVVAGGFGGGVLEFMAAENLWSARVVTTGLPDRFVPHATPVQLRHDLGLDAAGIRKKVVTIQRQDVLHLI